MAEEGESLSGGSLRLYALPSPASPSGEEPGVRLPSTPVGSINLYNYDPLNRRAAVGIMVASEHRRQGYALAMLQALESDFMSPSSVLHSLYADIAAPNVASLALFAKAGYTRCGHFKEWLEYDSHFIDCIRMQKILQ